MEVALKVPILFGLLALAACTSKTDTVAVPAPTQTQAQTPTESTSMPTTQNASVRQQLQVQASGGKVVVKVSVDNGTAAPVYVPKAVFEDDEIFRREFQITDKASGAEVDYIGPMVKRGAFTRDDYVAVAPGARLENSIDITRSYDFKPGATYQLAYPGAYLADVAQLNASSPVTVAPVTFTFTQ